MSGSNSSASKAQPNRVRMFSVYVSDKSADRVAQTLRSGYIGEGPVVREFEKALREIIGVPYPVAVNSCTSALHMALVMAGVRAGDEVITTAQTMMATSHAIQQQQALPVFADVQYDSANINPHDIEHRLTERTKAILVVHWGGYPCDLDEIHSIAARYSLPVIEDAAHAIGATYHGKPVGSISPYTCFSFQAIKHVTCGDGGAICLLDEGRYEEALRRRWYGIDRVNRRPTILGEPEWNVTEAGYKYHMNDIAASVGIENLKLLPELLHRRRRIAAYYEENLHGVPGVTLFQSKPDRLSAYWLFSLHVQEREEFVRMMADKGVEVSVVHLRIDRNDIFGGLREDLPVLDKLTQTIISLPIHNHLTDEDVGYIVDCIMAGW
jgi:perosamine synthetase